MPTEKIVGVINYLNNNKLKKIINLYVLFFVFHGIIAQNSLVQYDYESLNKLKTSLQFQIASSETQKVYRDLVKRADKILTKKNPTVIDKELRSPSGDQRDYLSISRYWWPDESKENGLPWVRKDGETNPDTQTDAVDRKRLGRMTNYVKTLSLAYFLTEEEKYAKKCASVLRTWFIDPRTRMNPNLKYAQCVPGNGKSRRSGILDGREIPLKVLDGVALIAHSRYWKKKDDECLKKWLNEYVNWLVSSPVGKDGARQANNHGSWYYYQLAALAYYNKDIPLIKDVVEKTKTIFESQLDERGGQHHELKRTRSFFYSCFNLDALTRIGIIAEKSGLSIWDYTCDGEYGGVVFQKAIDFLLPVVYGGKWDYKTKKKDDKTCLASVLLRVAERMDNNSYKKALKLLVDESITSNAPTKRQRRIRNDHYFVNQGLFKL